MASVWCALDRILDRHVAIKLLAEPYANDELAGRRFTREARVAARLSGHGNVVTIYDVGRALPSDDVPLGRPFIVMEYLPGGTVADALRTGELDQPLILEWLRQAAAALDFAHRRGVIHRDVKLSNFLLDRERVLHVGDFGIAQLGSEDTLSSSGHVLGTAAYLAPERALGLPATESSDRYALAVAAFELLVGQRPFAAPHFAAQARQHVEEPPPSASRRNVGLPPAIDAVLARGMAKHPDERFGAATELVDQIEQVLSLGRERSASLRGPASPPPAMPIYGSHRRGRMVALAALAAVLLGVALAAAATVLPTSSQRTPAVRSHALLAQHRARPAIGRAASDQRPASSTKSAPASAPPSTAPSTSPPTTASAPPPTNATALEAEGHQLMVGGSFHSAIQVLRQAVAAAPHTSLTYAYALYDLGRSLRLAGDPRAAVPILWQRLQIPNQTDVVRYELTLALEALGQRQTSSGAGGGPLASRSDGPHHHHGGSGPGNSQGD
jgi:serine/threonine-protein kinase